VDKPLTLNQLDIAHEVADKLRRWINVAPLPATQLHDVYNAHVLLLDFVQREQRRIFIKPSDRKRQRIEELAAKFVSHSVECSHSSKPCSCTYYTRFNRAVELITEFQTTECTSPCIDNYCPIHGIEAERKA
jgi:hypothetical protein